MMAHNQNPIAQAGLRAISKLALSSLSLDTTIQTYWGKVRSVFVKPSNRLFALVEVEATCKSLKYRCIGVQMAPLSQIRGSASLGRLREFDGKFRPLPLCNQERWQSIVNARQCGSKLPPVILTRVGDIYFVEDGHHRISVAQAWGEQEIEAVVTVWHVAGALPWQ